MRRPLILSVDDTEINRYIRAQSLTAADFDVLEARTGREALEHAFRERPDLVLLDVNLPDANGGDICRQIKKDPRTRGTMVLQISASAVGIADAVRGLEGGADGYLVEPVEGELLVAHVRSLLRLRDSEMALRQANERLEQFASMASHDLQEPLRPILIYARLLEREAAPRLTDRDRQHLLHLIDGASRLHTLLTDLLSYSRLATMQQTEFRVISLEECLRNALSALDHLVKESHATVTHDELPQVEGDATGITHVLQNLLSNAMKYRSPERELQVHVGVEKRARDVVVSVTDNGQGFSPQFAEHVFGAFKRLHSQETPGSGMGLAICRAIVERHQGTIWAESEPGKGSSFRFSVPAYRPTGQEPSDRSARLTAESM